MQRPFRRRRLAPAALVAVLALAGAASAAGRRPATRRPRSTTTRRSASTPTRTPASPTSSVARSSPRRPNVPWARVRAEDRHVAADLRPRVQERRVETQGQSLNIQANQEAEAPSIDFAGTGRTVPWTSWYEPNSDTPGGKTQDLRQPLQRRQQHLDPRGPGPRAAEPRPLAEHPHRPGRREPGARRRGRQGRRRSRAVGGLAGDRRRRRQEPDLRLARRQAERLRRLHAERRPQRLALLLAADRPQARRRHVAGLQRQRRSVAEHRPQARRHRARLRLHRHADTVPWVVWYEKDATARGAAQQRAGLRGQGRRRHRRRRRWLPLAAVGNGTAGQTNVLDGAHGAAAPPRRTPRTSAR